MTRQVFLVVGCPGSRGTRMCFSVIRRTLLVLLLVTVAVVISCERDSNRDSDSSGDITNNNSGHDTSSGSNNVINSSIRSGLVPNVYSTSNSSKLNDKNDNKSNKNNSISRRSSNYVSSREGVGDGDFETHGSQDGRGVVMQRREVPLLQKRNRRQIPRDRPGDGLLRISGGDVSGLRRYVELHLVTDTLLYRHYGDAEKLKQFCTTVVSYANALLESLSMTLVLQRLEVWSSSNKINIVSNYSVTLNRFRSHRIHLLKQGVASDVTVLLTKADLDGTTVGYALIGSMCSDNAVALVEAHSDDAVDVAHTVAHELGHVLGMSHDDASNELCSCKETQCVMAPSLNHHLPTIITWSKCSAMYLAAHLLNGQFSCLMNLPRAGTGRIHTCGDGVLDPNEQCDCGPHDTCRNPCCDSNTCKFQVNATCASGPCCDLQKCTVHRAATLCRKARSECDLPEYCSGWSETCHEDSHKQDGAPCDDGKGHCVSGRCGSHRVRCETLFGGGTQVAAQRCYDGNVHGSQGQNCGVQRRSGTSSATYKRCHQLSTLCGSIYCRPLPRRPHQWSHGILPWQRQPLCTTISTSVPGLELVPDGAVCGHGKMCLQQQCVPVPAPSSSCGKFGISNNNNGHCHCDAGFAPPYCTRPGYGGSVDSGHAADPTVTTDINFSVYLISSIFIPLMCVTCFVFLMLNVRWETNKQINLRHPDTCTRIQNAICCCMSAYVTKTLTDAGFVVPIPNTERDGDWQEQEGLNGSPALNRQTICQVDIDIATPKPEPNSWGTANDSLFTDLITITPKNSPDMHKRIRLPSNSPLLHHRSQDHLQRPKYHKSFSTDSGCISDIDESKDKSSLNLSMGSIVSVFMKAGKGKRSREGSAEPELRNPKTLNTQKSIPLRRLVVDPYAPKRHSRPDNETSDKERPKFNRSVSSDEAKTHHINDNVSNAPQLHGRKSNNYIGTAISSDDEQIHGKSLNGINKVKIPMMPPNKWTSSSSSNKMKAAIIPSKRSNPLTNSSNTKATIEVNGFLDPPITNTNVKCTLTQNIAKSNHDSVNSNNETRSPSDASSSTESIQKKAMVPPRNKNSPGPTNGTVRPGRPAPSVPPTLPNFGALKKPSNEKLNKIPVTNAEDKKKKKAMLPPASFASSKMVSSSASQHGLGNVLEHGGKTRPSPPKVPLLPKHFRGNSPLSHTNIGNGSQEIKSQNGFKTVRDLAKKLEINT